MAMKLCVKEVNVSIPFKRESPFGLYHTTAQAILWRLFQFPSNGKVLSDERHSLFLFLPICSVSIPFKRESPFGRASPRPGSRRIQSFNSLQTGKSFRTEAQMRLKKTHQQVQSFNSLQTGKSFRTRNPMNNTFILNSVSIPFKRESPFGRVSVPNGLSLSFLCFNSLQTGKSFRTDEERDRQSLGIAKFQFPSNGKVLSDR